MRFVNLTEDEINILTPFGVFSVPPSGNIARVEVTETEGESLPITRIGCHGECAGCHQEIDQLGFGCMCDALGIPWYIPTVITEGEVTGLPGPQPGTVYIVSDMVAELSPRPDVVSPGPLERDSTGQVRGCRGLRRSMKP